MFVVHLAVIACVALACGRNVDKAAGLEPDTVVVAATCMVNEASEMDKEASISPAGDRPLPEGAQRHQLKNGLTYILFPTDKANHVALDVLFGVGDLHDPEGKSGLSHLLEHIYVTAAAGNEPSRTVTQYMQRYPLGWNAQTGEDYTIIATVFEKERLAMEIEDAANRMGALDPKQSDLDREVPRLLEEVNNMFGGMPQLAVLNHARNNVRPSSVEHRKGGVPEQVKLIGLNDVIHWWLDHYKPSNAVLVLAGDFDPMVATALIEKHFGPIPDGKVPAVVDTPGPPNVGKINTIKIQPRMPGSKAYACIAFNAPLPGDQHHAACLVIVSRMFSQLMGGGYQVMFSPLDDPFVISISAPMLPDQTDENAIAGIRAFLDNAINKPIAPMEIKMVKNSLGWFFGAVDFPATLFQVNIYGVAFSIGRCEQLAVDSKKLSQAIDGLADKDIQDAAAAVFDKKKQVSVVVKPN